MWSVLRTVHPDVVQPGETEHVLAYSCSGDYPQGDCGCRPSTCRGPLPDGCEGGSRLELLLLRPGRAPDSGPTHVSRGGGPSRTCRTWTAFHTAHTHMYNSAQRSNRQNRPQHTHTWSIHTCVQQHMRTGSRQRLHPKALWLTADAALSRRRGPCDSCLCSCVPDAHSAAAQWHWHVPGVGGVCVCVTHTPEELPSVRPVAPVPRRQDGRDLVARQPPANRRPD